MTILSKIIKYIFQKWIIVFSTQKVEKYMEIKARLNENNMEVKTESISSGGGEGGGYGFATTYHVKVKPEDLSKANKIIHKHR